MTITYIDNRLREVRVVDLTTDKEIMRGRMTSLTATTQRGFTKAEVSFAGVTFPVVTPAQCLSADKAWTDAAVRHTLGLMPAEVFRATRGLAEGSPRSGRSTDRLVRAAVLALNGEVKTIAVQSLRGHASARGTARDLRSALDACGGAPGVEVIARSFGEDPSVDPNAHYLMDADMYATPTVPTSPGKYVWEDEDGKHCVLVVTQPILDYYNVPGRLRANHGRWLGALS